ncbi:MAG: RNA-binding S4 domain-containing protein [Odoribacter sp.]|nr:pseudouridine synthase [Bacteroidales bacterium]MBR2980718.1 RNA-binding S4 domain-containing protein [Odoribacter sp.]
MEEQKKKFHGSREAGTFRERPERRENRFGERRESRFGERRESRFGEKREFKPRREGGYERREGSFERREGGYQQRSGYGRRDGEFGGRQAGPKRFGRPQQAPFGEKIRRAYDSSEQYDKVQKHLYSQKKQLEYKKANPFAESDEIRLNRYISIAGVCSRRDADKLIAEGKVAVNGQVVTEMGVKVRKADIVEVEGKIAVPERKVYLVLNKPKDYVTTVEDPQERKTVMSLIEGACQERIYPVGRLDRMTTGVLLFTNDGDLAKKLTHPSYEHKKIYHVFLNRALSLEDFAKISEGVELEDGLIAADEISYASDDKTEVGIQIHSGRNRIVRRIFEHLGYEIVKLDRVYFAGLTKKDLPRGHWRMLTAKEVNYIKYFNN